MTREQAKELLPIIQALTEGKIIQDKIEGLTDWVDTDEINLEYNGQKIKHRIKIEPKYRPFKTKEECWNEMLKHHPFGWVKYGESICSIQNIVSDNITITDYEELYYFDLNDSFMNLKFTDNTPFGIKEE